MRATALLPRRVVSAIAGTDGKSRPVATSDPASKSPDAPQPSWINRQVTRVLLAVADRVCMHPIHTIVVTALLASTTYIGLLEGSLTENVRNAAPGTVNIDWLLEGGRNLRIGESTGWTWISESHDGVNMDDGGVEVVQTHLGDKIASNGQVCISHATGFSSCS